MLVLTAICIYILISWDDNPLTEAAASSALPSKALVRPAERCLAMDLGGWGWPANRTMWSHVQFMLNHVELHPVTDAHISKSSTASQPNEAFDDNWMTI